MSVLVFADNSEGIFKKTALEIVSYGKRVAEQAGSTVVVLTINADDTSALSDYGADKILAIKDSRLDKFNAKAYADCIQQASIQENADIVVVDSTNNGLYLAPILAINLKAGYASNVVDLPDALEPFTIKRNAFSSKGFNFSQMDSEKKLLSLARNSFGLKEQKVVSDVQEFTPELDNADFQIKSVAIEQTSGKVTIADADIVVSGGRGLKGPENWGMIEELAEVLGAATACSKPVSDLGWRPHGEHVGQTGKPVSSNLYIAIGISGAIQHLAGVNSSKTKVVINNDSEAPFFKAADYGVVGDAFEVVPEFIKKLKEFKSTL